MAFEGATMRSRELFLRTSPLGVDNGDLVSIMRIPLLSGEVGEHNEGT